MISNEDALMPFNDYLITGADNSNFDFMQSGPAAASAATSFEFAKAARMPKKV